MMGSRLSADQDEIDRKASEWLVQVEEGPLLFERKSELEQWLDEDPRHVAAFDEMRQIWGELALAELETAPSGADELLPAERNWWPYSVAAGFAAIAAALIAFFVLPGHNGISEQRYATAFGQTRIVRLDDGSNVTLGSRSAIIVRFSDAERRVILSAGEAFFDVAAQKGRPFLVEAGRSLVRDIGTKFDMNLTDRTLRLTVASGMVKVAGSRDPALSGAQMLKAGQRTEVVMSPYGEHPSILFGKIQKTSALSAGAWREGRLVFDDVRLSDMAADISRYYEPGVRVAASDAGNLRVTASFRVDEIPAFMSALSATLPVTVTRDIHNGFLVSRSNIMADRI